MLRRTLSTVNETAKAPFADQENNFDELNSSSNVLPTPSPNRSKYEGKFGKRRPLQEKTNKSSNSAIITDKTLLKCNTDNTDKSKESSKQDVTENSNKSTSGNSDTSFQDLFHLNSSVSSKNTHNTHSHNHSDTSSSKIEELTAALSETLKENEELHDTVTLLKAEIDRLSKEVLENQEYAELYLLGKELIENQAEEIENLKKKLRGA